MQVWVIEYSDTDGTTSAQGVFTSEVIGVAWIEKQAEQMIADNEYEGDEAILHRGRTYGDYPCLYLGGGDKWELVPMGMTDSLPPPSRSVEAPLEDQYPQRMGDRGTIGPEDRFPG